MMCTRDDRDDARGPGPKFRARREHLSSANTG